MEESLDPGLDPLLLRKFSKNGNSTVLKMGDRNLDYSSAFKFYMTTKLSNPKFEPAVSSKVTLINFALTAVGLQDQLLSIAVSAEQPQLEADRNRLALETAVRNL